MKENIICHIVGINNILKEKLKEHVKCIYPKIRIVDVDKITDKIRNDKEIKELNEKIKNTKKKEMKKKYMKKIHRYWKIKIQEKIDKIVKNNKEIILIGLITYHKNHKLKIKIDTKNKFILKIEDKQNAKEVITYNLEKYKNHIINGKFPLKYIDYEFIIKQRNKIKKIYERMEYRYKSYMNITKWLEIKYKDKKETDKIIYVGSKNNYNKNITIKKKRRNKKLMNMLDLDNQEIIGYNSKWLALLSSINGSHRYFKKGYMHNNGKMKGYIEEKKKGDIKELEKGCYIYKCNIKEFNKIEKNKYKTNQEVNILEKEKINNIKEELEKEKIKIIKKK